MFNKELWYEVTSYVQTLTWSILNATPSLTEAFIRFADNYKFVLPSKCIRNEAK